MIYEVERTRDSVLLKNHLNLGGENGREKIEITSRYLMKNGKPWIPFMGEYHFSRANLNEWRRELCKMKAGGINTVASYVIWIHHEEIEGEIDFSGNLDIRRFVKTCFECGLYVLLRIGPWIHGEVKNGGFPDWLVQKPSIKLRCNDSVYLEYCEKWYKALAQQLDGLLFKDNGGLIGFQIENELIRDETHLSTLLDMAKRAGLDAPIYTATAWGIPSDADLPQNQFLPMFGAYPERPWTNHSDKLEPSKHYFFSNMRNDHTIGADLIETEQGSRHILDYNKYPFATCEMGGGVQPTYPRRPVITGDDVAAITNVKLGSGANLLGYYMYHGGRNPIGKTTTMQETKKSGYPNDLPAIDYDFQAQLGAWGAVRKHYRRCRITALFLEDFGELLAECRPYFQKEKITSIHDCESLRYSMRLKENSGFVFINNYSREQTLAEHKAVQFSVDGTPFPRSGLHIKDGDFGFLPYNITLDKIKLKYAAAQLLCRYENTFFFFTPFDGNDEICICKHCIKTLAANAEIIETETEFIIKNIKDTINLTSTSGDTVKIVVLTSQEAERVSRNCGKIFLSEGELFSDDGQVFLYGTQLDNFSCQVYNGESFFNCAIEEKKIEPAIVTFTETVAFESEYMQEFELGGSPVRKYFEITLPENRENLFLCFDITGDIAQLYADGTFVADTFLNGRNWYVGPDEFLNCQKLHLVVSALSPAGKYLETDKNSGISINRITGKRVYTLKVYAEGEKI